MVIDTSIFIEYLRKNDKANTQLYKVPENVQFYISAVTFYELIMGATTKEKRGDIDKLTSEIPILSFNEEVAVKAGEIYHYLKKENKMIEFRDIFIASTCLVNELPIKTLNIKHFERIQGLEVIEMY